MDICEKIPLLLPFTLKWKQQKKRVKENHFTEKNTIRINMKMKFDKSDKTKSNVFHTPDGKCTNKMR